MHKEKDTQWGFSIMKAFKTKLNNNLLLIVDE